MGRFHTSFHYSRVTSLLDDDWLGSFFSSFSPFSCSSFFGYGGILVLKMDARNIFFVLSQGRASFSFLLSFEGIGEFPLEKKGKKDPTNSELPPRAAAAAAAAAFI